MRPSELDYDLPERLIAQEPAPCREDARLLVLDRAGGTPRHRCVRDLPALLGASDLLVLNDTRVLPARLAAARATGGAVEVLLLEAAERGRWRALVRAGGALREGEELALPGGDRLRLVDGAADGTWRVEGVGRDLHVLMTRHGRMPLPPYIRREAEDARDPLDRERYQTVYARAEGAVAAPTAGLHLTPALLEALERRGMGVARLTLHVGLGTFAPVRTERLEDHAPHEERFRIPPETARAVRRTREGGGRVVAVGTTVVRALETSARASEDGLPRSEAGRTRLLILPGHRFRSVDALLTNFHLPGTTLLALVAAFAGRKRTLAAYREAARRDYRFYSYGDAMLIL